jgi:hypothetical protein
MKVLVLRIKQKEVFYARNWRDIEKLAYNIKSIFKRRKDMKKLLVVLMAVAALTGLMAVPVFAADKLVVMDAGGVNPKFVVRDDGTVGVNNPTALGYNLDVSAGGTTSSSLHFSLNGTDAGGFVTAVNDNNFFLSSGVAYINGQWIQKASTNQSVIAGSGGMGYSVFLQDAAVGVGNPVNIGVKFRINYNGSITTQTSAMLTTGGVWQNASSREYKDNIQTLSAEKASETLKNLTPVTYNYKVDPEEKHVGFIAEDVPALVASNDRKGLSPMDIVAVLTKVVQEQNKTIEALSAKIDRLEKGTAK